MRAVFDPNVLISAVLSPRGTPAALVRAWVEGRFDLLVCPQLLDELGRALAYPKLRARVSGDQAAAFVAWLDRTAVPVADAGATPSVRSEDPADDYLIAVAERERAALVSGDRHLLALAGRIPVFAPREFVEMLGG